MTVHERLAALGTAIPCPLLPRRGTDLSKWAVIACDQFTQDRRYWERAAAAVGDAPSALHCVFPEAFLGDPGREGRMEHIRRTMKKYLREELFTPRRGCVYVERDTPYHRGRRGLLVCLDLERYDWSAAAAPLVRPTEGTVPERLPLRMELRRGAALELPHILVLVDDEEDSLLGTLGERARPGEMLYDTALEPGSGRVRGWLLDREADWEYLAGGLEKLAAASFSRYALPPGGTSSAKEALSGEDPAAGDSGFSGAFLYAVGDGNHSLAAAKGVWEECKGTQSPSVLPADSSGPRWAMVELENLYDPALAFEPIHRFVYGAEETEKLFAALPGFSLAKLDGTGAWPKLLSLVKEKTSRSRFGIIAPKDGDTAFFLVETDPVPLVVDYIQPLLDDFLKNRPELSMDYIHGEEELFRLAQNSAGTGILLPPFNKRGLFRTVAERGPLPRKSFSMGEASEKRFYLECRKLFG
ncbi:MAG: DUF1015 domain-containing protein [Treponema sp.]|jgi:hypothetical protein|nr:DUF1015 domain-containing protein [Treponema sp.]